jgi:hypothetical protein
MAPLPLRIRSMTIIVADAAIVRSLARSDRTIDPFGTGALGEKAADITSL